MAFRRDETDRPTAAGVKPAAKPAATAANTRSAAPSTGPPAAGERLTSLDAYRGLTMLLMASSGLAIDGWLAKKSFGRFDGTAFEGAWKGWWHFVSRQFDHVAWTGCVAWDLIQPSFMFIVGVAMPFSYAKRKANGDTWARQFGHAVLRALILILLGIFLRSRGAPLTNFTFEDVLTQIGLGYLFVFLLLGQRFWVHLLAVLAILGGYWYFFYHHPLPPPEGDLVTRYLEVKHQPPAEWNQFTGLAAHWNKHTNAAAEFDRTFLNLFPRSEKPWEGKKFWVNGGGYQTLSFVPSIATMILGLMAGQLLRSSRTSREKLIWLVSGGAICFVVAMAIDTTIWPFSVARLNYTLCPTVKRIWTPTWAVFSGGWALWFLALFYWVIDVRGFRRLAFPLAIVGMNSIAVYCMHQLIEGWLGSSLKTHLGTVDALTHKSFVPWLFNPDDPVAAIARHASILFLIWLICLWLYRRRIFIRI